MDIRSALRDPLLGPSFALLNLIDCDTRQLLNPVGWETRVTADSRSAVPLARYMRPMLRLAPKPSPDRGSDRIMGEVA